MKHLLGILIFLFSLPLVSKGQERPIVQFSGIIYNADSNVVVPYVSVTNLSDKKKVVSANHQGYFSFVAHAGDTIVFSSIGYNREAIIIPPNITDKKYTVIIKMKAQIINLPMVRVLPWASIDDFNRVFMSMKFADDDLEIARKNVARTSILAAAKTLPRDGMEMNAVNFQNNHIALSNKNMNMQGANQLMNPFAWGALIQQIMRGDKSRSDNN
jgi:UDP-N-acetylglucosamine transferase subunit ALG13